MSRKEAVTISFPPRAKKLATAKAEANGESFSGYLLRLAREDMARDGVNVDLPPDELAEKMAQWFEKHGAFEDEKPAKKGKRKK